MLRYQKDSFLLRFLYLVQLQTKSACPSDRGI